MNKDITAVLSEKIEAVLSDNDISLSGKKVLIGLSGGADSTCLALIMKQLSEKNGFDICCAHVNHMIRGQEADRDEVFSSELCKRHGIEFFSRRCDVPALAEKTGESIETAARNARYSIFSDICKEHCISFVATAHTSSDNAETMLFNLVRGSGTNGLCGIPAKRKLSDGVTVIRPILYVTREENEQYLDFAGEKYVTDSTNLEDDCTRNYLRHEIIPRLKKLNPSLERTMTRSSLLISADRDCLENTASESFTDDIGVLSSLDKAISTRIVISAFSKATGGGTLEKVHIDALMREIDISAKQKGRVSEVSLPCGFTAVIEKGKLGFTSGEQENYIFDIPLKEGANYIPKAGIAIFLSFNMNSTSPDVLNYDENIYKKYNTVDLYSDIIFNNLSARSRRNADTVRCGGMTRSVKQLLSKAGVPVRERYGIPFICRRGEIICIPGAAVSDGYDKKKTYALRISLYKY